METKIIEQIAKEQNIKPVQIEHTLDLLEQGATIPFIARYRKEHTQGLDEEQIRTIQEAYEYQVHLEKRKEEVLEKIKTLGRLDDKIVQQVQACSKLVEIEEIYRPYKQKKKTRAGIAIANGLEPLATLFLSLPRRFDEREIDAYLNENVPDRSTAIQQAKDILAEQISNDGKIRDKIYDSMTHYGRLVTKEKKEHTDQQKVYQKYYDYTERIETVADHRIMAIDRAEKEKVITVSITCNEDYLQKWIEQRMIRYPNNPTAVYVKEAIADGLHRLAIPSVERLIRSNLTERAQKSSTNVFAMNLEKLLLQPPIKNKRVLGFDPAFRTGCKLAVLDESGKMLHVDVIYPHPPKAQPKAAAQKLIDLCRAYKIDIIAIGNGTASRESEAFVAKVIREANLNVSYTIVSEAGASVYSASKLAISEFPDLHVEQRSAISIGRRLQDPLSELIKIDPQSIGVGQYQHDLPAKELKERLDFVVKKAVNRVGVNINTASAVLLKNVAGLNATTANNIVTYREENGPIRSRKDITKIPKIGAKAFEQAAGFLRIEDGNEPLDRTSIHPESYSFAMELLETLGLTKNDLGTQKARQAIQNLDPASVAMDAYTTRDILEAIAQPLRDYRDRYDAPILRKDILSIEDLHIGDQLEGVVRNVVDFGAFVDIGLHEDGLVHISQMGSKRVKHPSDIVAVGDIIQVWVLKIDEQTHKVGLTMRKP